MFAFIFNAVWAVVYTFAALTSPEVMSLVVWAGGFHTALAISIAAVALLNRKREG